MKKSDLPFGSEFSPSQIDLLKALNLAKKHCGNWKAFESEVRAVFFENYNTSDRNKNKLANNTKLGMIAYKLIDRDVCLTAVGEKLLSFANDEERFYEEFANHILLNLNGMNLLQCIRDIQFSGEIVDLIKLREWLNERGIYVPRGGKQPSVMRLWLQKAGIFSSGWRVNESNLNKILKLPLNEYDALAQLTIEQRSYLKTIANIQNDFPIASNEIERLAIATYGVKFNEKNLAKQVLYPLQDSGYINLKRGTHEKGRGAKPFFVEPSKKLDKELMKPLLAQLEKQIKPELRLMLIKPFKEILSELNSDDKHTKGLALEALGFKLMRLIDLQYVATRLRGDVTGGAEVDLIFEASRLVFSRWQIQCKNTKRVSLDDIAKEVGLTHFLKSNVIVIVSTGDISNEARTYSNKIMQDSNLCIVIIDSDDLMLISQTPPAIIDVLNREAKLAMKLKALEI